MTDESASTEIRYGAKTVFAPFDDLSPDMVAEGLDTLVERAIDDLAEAGYVPLGPASITAAGWSESIYDAGSNNPRQIPRSGIVATITYRSR